jgi:hypothetical protein
VKRNSDDNGQNVSWATFRGQDQIDLRGKRDDPKKMNLNTKVIGPTLLLIPMACSHLGDGHHSGDQHSLIRQPSYQHSTYERATRSRVEDLLTQQNTMKEQEGTEAQPEVRKEGDLKSERTCKSP